MSVNRVEGATMLTNIGKLDAFLDEEDWNVIADDIPVPLIGVELDSKAAYITHSIS